MRLIKVYMHFQLEKKESDTDVGVNECNELKNTLATLIESCKTIYSEFKTKRETVITNRKKHVQELDYNSGKLFCYFYMADSFCQLGVIIILCFNSMGRHRERSLTTRFTCHQRRWFIVLPSSL